MRNSASDRGDSVVSFDFCFTARFADEAKLAVLVSWVSELRNQIGQRASDAQVARADRCTAPSAGTGYKIGIQEAP